MATVTQNEKKSDLSKEAVKSIKDNAKPVESKSTRFIRLANRRVPRAIKTIGYVRNLAARTNYEYSDVQAQKILSALEDAVKAVQQSFAVVGSQAEAWVL